MANRKKLFKYYKLKQAFNLNKDLRLLLGKTVTVTVDRQLGTTHPNHKNIVYELNYGYLKGFIGGDGEWQDAYVMGENRPRKVVKGKVIAIICRKNDNEDKLVVSANGIIYSTQEIIDAVNFQERFFDIEIIV